MDIGKRFLINAVTILGFGFGSYFIAGYALENYGWIGFWITAGLIFAICATITDWENNR